jgi:acid phosphatase type 7
MRARDGVVLSAVFALGACQVPLHLRPDSGVAVSSDVESLEDATVDDLAAATEAGRSSNDPIDYVPEGCAHRVRTTPMTRANYMADTSTFGPAAEPRAPHVSWAADPSSTIAFVWTTDRATRASVVQFGTAPAALDRVAVGHVSSAGSGEGGVTAHEVHVCGLAPDTTYYYRVGGEGHFSAVQSFKTAPATGDATAEINFVVAGDSRNGYATLRSLQERIMSVSGMRQPDFEVFSGDAVFLGTSQAEWNEWFASCATPLATMPFLMAHGNHDALSLNYLVQFAQPQAGVMEQDELYFSYDYGLIHFVVLNDTPFRGDLAGNVAGTQLNWLRQDLTRARANRGRVPWIVVVHHKPAFSSARYADAVDTVFIRQTWAPVFDEFGVDIVFSGHDHEFEVSKEIDGQGREVVGRRGTVYMISAGAGAELYPVGSQPWRRYSESVSNFLLVHVTARNLDVTPHRIDGTVINEGRVSLVPRT